jgi:ABC-type proline/glycine betaine transport system permease subunit
MSPMNNSSFFTADRTTHLKIVVVSLLASIVVMVIGIAARPQATDSTVQATVYKPPKAILATSDTVEKVR